MRKKILFVTLLAFAISGVFGKVHALWDPILPTDPVKATFHHPGPTSYWQTTLSMVPDGYDVSNGTYVGWCVDEYHYIYQDSTVDVELYSSYDPNLPTYFITGAGARGTNDFDLVNWIINNKVDENGDPITDWLPVQEAIWYFVNGGGLPTTTTGEYLRQGALNYEASFGTFEPGTGEFMAIVLDTNTGKNQGTIIEVPVSPVPEASTLLLFGSGLSGLLVLARKKGLIRL